MVTEQGSAGFLCITAQSGHRFVSAFEGSDETFERRGADGDSPSLLKDLVGPFGRCHKHEAGQGLSVCLSCGAQPGLLVWTNPQVDPSTTRPISELMPTVYSLSTYVPAQILRSGRTYLRSFQTAHP